MPKATSTQNSFVLGEISPRAEGRFDADRPIWKSGARIIENFLLFQTGGAMFWPGTAFVAEVKNSAAKIKLLKFRYSNIQSYVIEASAGYMRFFANFGQVLSAPSTPAQITTIYGQSDLANLKTANKADVMYIVDGTHRPQKLTRLSSTSFSISPVQTIGGPFLDYNTDQNTKITPNSATGSTTLSVTIAAWGSGNLYVIDDWVSSGGVTYRCVVPHLSGSGFAADLALGYWIAELFFKAGHVGALYKVGLSSSSFGCVLIATVNANGLSATGNVQALASGAAGNLGTTSATTYWAEGAFSDYRGWPIAVTFHEGRLVYGSPNQFFDGSVVGAFDDFSAGASDSDAYRYQASSDLANDIRWIATTNPSLQIGTSGGTFTAQGTSGIGITPTTPPSVTPDTDYSVLPVSPVKMSSYIYYLQGNGFNLRQLVFDFIINKQKCEDMNMLADHVLRDGSGAVYMDRQQSPNDRVWCVRNDGQLAVFVRNVEQQIMGWCRRIGGSTAAGPGLFEDVAILPQDNGDDVVWVVVKRIINGSVKRYIEYFTPELFSNYWEPNRLDCSLTLDNPKTITGITNAVAGIITTSTAHGLTDGDQIKIDSVVGLTGLNTNIYYVANATTYTFTLKDGAGNDIDTTLLGTYISGGQVRKMVTVITGLDHLIGETVSVFVDGGLPAATQTFVVRAVTGGYGFELPNPAAVVYAGLPYTGTLKLLPLGDGSAIGTGQTKVRRMYLTALRLWKSLGGKIGIDINRMSKIIYPTQTPNLLPSHAPAPYTGDIEKFPFATWSKSQGLIIQQTEPLPMMVLACCMTSEEEDK